MESEVPDSKVLAQKSELLSAKARALKCTNDPEYQVACRFLGNVAALRKEIETTFAAPKKAAHEAHKAIIAAESKLLEEPLAAERKVKAIIADYLREEQKRRREAEEAAQAALKRQAEDDIVAQAAALERAGQSEVAAAVLDTPIVAPVVEFAKPKAAGVSSRPKFTYKIVDAKAINPAFLKIDEQRIAATVRNLGKDAEKVVGGIEVLQDVTVVARTPAGDAA
jgi:hypothetical protein